MSDVDKLPQLIRRCCNLQLQLVNEVHEMCTCKTTPHVSQCILEVWVWTNSFLMYALWCVEYTQHLLPITDKDESAHFSLLRIWNFSESFCVEDTVQVFCVPFVPGRTCFLSGTQTNMCGQHRLISTHHPFRIQPTNQNSQLLHHRVLG